MTAVADRRSMLRSPEKWCALAASGNLVARAAAVDSPTGEYAAEPKLDGWRLLAVVCEDIAGGRFTRLYARSGQEMTKFLPHIAKALAFLPPGTVLDGEAVVLRRDGDRFVNEWGKVQSVLTTINGHPSARAVTFMAFDVLAHAEIDARSLPYKARRSLLERIHERLPAGPIKLVPVRVASGEELDRVHEAFLRMGFEGTMLKPLLLGYASGKRRWLKWKPQKTREYVVMGFKDGRGSLTGLVGAIRYGAYVGGTLKMLGSCSGFDMQTRRHMTANPDEWLGTVIEVAHYDATKQGGRNRSPQFKRRRPDRSPLEIEL